MSLKDGIYSFDTTGYKNVFLAKKDDSAFFHCHINPNWDIGDLSSEITLFEMSLEDNSQGFIQVVAVMDGVSYTSTQVANYNESTPLHRFVLHTTGIQETPDKGVDPEVVKANLSMYSDLDLMEELISRGYEVASIEPEHVNGVYVYDGSMYDNVVDAFIDAAARLITVDSLPVTISALVDMMACVQATLNAVDDNTQHVCLYHVDNKYFTDLRAIACDQEPTLDNIKTLLGELIAENDRPNINNPD